MIQPPTCCNGVILSLLMFLFIRHQHTSDVDAFTTTTTTTTINIATKTIRHHQQHQQRNIISLSSSSSSNSEVEALLAAAAKAREEANRLSEVLFISVFILFCGCVTWIVMRLSCVVIIRFFSYDMSPFDVILFYIILTNDYVENKGTW